MLSCDVHGCASGHGMMHRGACGALGLVRFPIADPSIPADRMRLCHVREQAVQVSSGTISRAVTQRRMIRMMTTTHSENDKGHDSQLIRFIPSAVSELA